MKPAAKIIAVFMLLAICLSLLPSCGKTNIRLDGKTFEFAHARTGTKNEIRVCSTALSETYKDIRTVDYTLKADGKKLTITGEGGTYTGEYKVDKLLDESVVYKISIGEEEGHASLSAKALENGTVKYTLIITIRGYYVTFTSYTTAE